MGNDVPDEDSVVVPSTPEVAVPEGPPTNQQARNLELNDRDRNLAIYIEKRMLQVIRKEIADPYGGLPADDVLYRLDSRFPDVHFPERMMARLEAEQTHRHGRELRLDELATYEAETRRLDIQRMRDEEASIGRRAERVVYLLLLVGVLLLFTGHEGAGQLVVGSTLVTVVTSFLARRVQRGK